MGQVERRVAELRARQHGVILVSQAVQLGMSASTVHREATSGGLRYVCRGVVTDAGSVLQPIGLLSAHLLAGGEGVVASGRSALALDGFVPHPDTPELLSLHGRRLRGGIRAARRTGLSIQDTVWRSGMRSLKIELALVEAADRMERVEVGDVLDRILKERRSTPDRMRTAAMRLRRRGASGPTVVRGLLDERDAVLPTESTLEDRFGRVVGKLGLTWHAQVLLRDADGERIVRADFTCVEHPGLVVECDGWLWHSGHAAFERDTERRTRLAAEGLAPLVFTWAHVTRRPASVRRLIERRIETLTAVHVR